MKKYIVRLSVEEREDLQKLVKKGKTQAYKIRHAQILLKADADGPCWKDGKICEAYGVSIRAVENIRQRFVEKGLEAALSRKKQDRPSRQRKLDGRGEAHLIAVSCSKPPEGRSRWTLELLAGKLVELKVVDSISGQTVRRVLKKTK